MNFTVSKTYQATKKWHPILAGIVFLMLLPFIVLTVLGVFIWYLFRQMKGMLIQKSELGNKASSEEKQVAILLERENMVIQLIEDPNGEEYNRVADLWCTQVYDEDIYVYRASTEPVIAGLSNAFITNFIKEMPDGAFLQTVNIKVMEQTEVIETSLIYLHYADLTIKIIDSVGPYLLYNHERKPHLICGFSDSGSIELLVT